MATSQEVRATKWSSIPGSRGDVMDEVAEDIRKARRGQGVDSSDLKGGAREAVREAGRRATNRNLGRAGAVGAALQAGYEIGSDINKRTGLSDKIVDVASRNTKRERDIQRMLNEPGEESYASIARKVDAEMAAEKAAKGDEPEPEYRGGPRYKKGGAVKSVSASKRADGIAQRGKTRGKVY